MFHSQARQVDGGHGMEVGLFFGPQLVATLSARYLANGEVEVQILDGLDEYKGMWTDIIEDEYASPA